MRILRKLIITTVSASTLLIATSAANADSGAEGAAVGSPGVVSGNVAQVPVHVPVNVCGNTVSVIGLLNPAFGNTCVNA